MKSFRSGPHPSLLSSQFSELQSLKHLSVPNLFPSLECSPPQIFPEARAAYDPSWTSPRIPLPISLPNSIFYFFPSID